ncbi:MAG: hypothetical protein JSW51_09575 [Gemmatimonadota bacterium]|nr:MAG: hypothetical protein JSW51_09575 [Gemmatimonadota bacterium]
MTRDNAFDISKIELPSLDLEPTRVKSRGRSWRARLLLTCLGLVTVVVLPFVVLVRTSTYLYADRDLPTWGSVGGGVLATTVLLTCCAWWVSKKLHSRARARWLGTRVVLPLVLAYCVYALLYLSSANAKGAEVRGYYRSLHPILRVAVSTVILIDRDMVVTDVARFAGDYARMGLPENRESMHYKQNDGFVHAVDLRTRGEGWWRNWLVEGYFRAMGFSTLRHRGTEDHLHVSLPLH